MNAVILIPARLHSSRLPKKMLADLCGEPLIVRTWRQAALSKLASRVVVATDSTEIAGALQAYGAEVVMTSPDAHCGSERVAEAARGIDADVFVNLQGDEPLIDPQNIDLCLQPFLQTDPPDCATLVYPVLPEDFHQIDDPNVVKVVMDSAGNALYFSRSPVPFQREVYASTLFYRHIGLYAFTSGALQRYAALPPSMLELAESLEQLRLLENGFRIACVKTTVDHPGVNTHEDLELVRRLISAQVSR
ncbi:MAG: 3-deoxy-manno-octulosonate cytidylyltransferase [Chlorobium sp.]|uniref:3-deoxy-manno-octulosonate cytidylyltransferase n=1 Tax=Chlorobium sp. TaxID=1095 RepID=UPI001DC91FC6|nr:3-deoxy-manno-octulosonate cytidylyltransferase [Chlorobium sp.]MBN1279595.1 3-deoxy-manno-octulosonate cytidylyltransferase [Chlorobiaceae bacterium]MCF8216099.1 3-deoxy-manno-octulosonate cytidylyltransferase [Chlorobium sp.]MCF8271000.1 3-deoxy-manno-octulosonate cytidylyltransferase [Chlorobium sp.]MCF8287354.1 3-deoxy-manno-octulosonate cytidylyltransferase [Chlorobium sp.]MCF8290913.1 3-deoxy-manno-octulosonate cytidylyltransferase [Chlorobium sp.]